MQQPEPTQEYLQFIEAFADTMAGTFKQFAHICREHLKKTNHVRNQQSDLRTQLIEERKKRMELEDKMKQILTGSNQEVKPEERKKPKNAFALFVADQRDKIRGEHPDSNFDFAKITSLAAIKWKNMKEEQRRVYEKKFQEIMKLYQEREKIQNQSQQPQQLKEATIKKEDESKIRKEPENGGQENRQDLINGEYPQNQESLLSKDKEAVPEAQATLMINQDNQATVPMEPEERPLEKILDLFHTPAQQNKDKNDCQHHIAHETILQQPVIQEHQPEKEKEPEAIEPKVSIDPSIQIIEQVVIDSTIQQPNKE